MRTVAILLLAVGGALAAFLPNVRIDHQNLPAHHCVSPAIAVGRKAPAGQPLYVVFEDNTWQGIDPVRMDVVFQKSTDAGATWLNEDRLIRRGEVYACYPDVTTDSDGNLYIVYTEIPQLYTYDGHLYGERSTDGGATWSAPTRIDDNEVEVRANEASIAVDAAGNLFCAWSDSRTGRSHIWSSVSTDHGTTWSPNVRVCDDTVPSGSCGGPDVFVQPGTNHYLVAATAPYLKPGYVTSGAYLYRSTDMGQTFQPGVRLDTLDYVSGPRVVADARHVICDYTGHGVGDDMTEARTLYTPPDTWGPCSPVTDTLHSSYYRAALALSADGRVHMALMMNYLGGNYDACYAFSTDHGVSWSDHERINDDTTDDKYVPVIDVDSAGHAYVVWQDGRNHRAEVWFSTNNTTGVAENRMPQVPSITLAAEPSVFSRTTEVRLSLDHLTTGPLDHFGVSVFDPSGRLVRTFPASSLLSPPFSLTWDGRNASGTRCPAGLYVIRCGTATTKVTFLPAD